MTSEYCELVGYRFEVAGRKLISFCFSFPIRGRRGITETDG